jgi:hypothetical protein
MEFPKFDGASRPLSWLNHCERFFHVRRTPDDKKVAFTAFYLLDDAQLWFHNMELNGGSPTWTHNHCEWLFHVRRTPESKKVAFAAFYLLDDAQLWFHHMELNSGSPTWTQFVQLVNARFGPPLTDSSIGELAMLRRSGTIDEFCNRFITLSCRNTSLTEQQQIELFIMCLGDLLRTDMALLQPATLDDAIILARAYEQRNASWDSVPQPSSHTSSRSSFKSALPSVFTSPTPAASASVNKPASSAIRLTPAEIAQRRKDGKCFRCDKFFTNGHKAVCKHIFSIEVIDDEVDDLIPDNTEPTILIHDLTGIQSCHCHTMQLRVDINGACHLTLLDSGSTHNFIDTEAAA